MYKNNKEVLGQLSTNTSIINSNIKEHNTSKMVEAFGHFANNQIKDGIVTWIQGGFWELKINTITNDNTNVSNSNILINNNNSKAEFIANFTMIKPDGSLSHNHDINNFVSSDVIITDKDIVVIGVANIYSDNNNTNEYKNVPLNIHLMGKKVLGLTIDVGKTEGHFSSPNADALYYLGVTAGVARPGRVRAAAGRWPRTRRAPTSCGARPTRRRARKRRGGGRVRGGTRRRPAHRRTCWSRSATCARQRRLSFAEARGYYARALELAPASYDALYGLGVCDSYARRARDGGRARSGARCASRRDSAPARLALGISLLQTGQTDGGRDRARGGGAARAPDAPGALPAGARLPGARRRGEAEAAFAQGAGAARSRSGEARRRLDRRRPSPAA